MLKNNETKQWLLKNFFAISAIVVTFANIIVAYKLYPFTLSISKLESRVLANENSIDLVREELKYILSRVDDIYNLLIKQ